MSLALKITNNSQSPMSDFAIQFNVNSFGLLPGLLTVPEISAGNSFTTTIPLVKGGQIQEMDPQNLLQVAIKNNVGVYYFSTLMPPYIN